MSEWQPGSFSPPSAQRHPGLPVSASEGGAMALSRLAKFFAGPSPHLSREDAMRVFRRDQFKCCYCGLDGRNDFQSWLILTVDHIHPHAKGGQRSMTNLVTACQPCNLLK